MPLTEPTIRPFPHQKEGIKLIEQFRGVCLLADDMGLGKTIQCLGALRRNADWLPALIVCPANVKYNWELEANLYFGMRASVCEGKRPPEQSTMLLHESPLTVINYDILKSWSSVLKKRNFKTVIFDECQYLGDLNSKRTKAATEVARTISRRIGVSGTPIQNRPVELFPVAHILWPKQFPSWMAFVERYCESRLMPWGWDFSGAKNLAELHQRLTELGMIRRRKEILPLPKKNRKVVVVDLLDPDEYRFASANFLDWIKARQSHRFRRIKKVEKLARVGYLLRLAAQLKMRSCVNRINQYLEDNPTEKVVVMAHHVSAIKILSERLNGKYIIIDGNTAGKQRQQAVEQFQKDPETRICLGNLKAAGVGITLTAARMMFVLEFWYNPAVHAQVEDRIHRIGQKRDCIVEYLVGRDTIEVDICRLLEKRSKIFRSAIDGEDYVESDLSLYEELLHILEGNSLL